MRILPILAAATLLAPGAALAAPAKAPTAAAKAPAAGQTPPPAVEHAMLYLRVLIGALQSDKVEQPIKGALVGCLYNNSLGKITEATDKLIADNPGKVSRDNPSQVLSAFLAVCGYKGEGQAPAGAAPKPGAAAPAAKPTGR